MNKKRFTAVYIDDEYLARTDFGLVISEMENFKLMDTFASIHAAQQKLEKTNLTVDFIFCDIEMPGGHGIDAVDVLRQYAQYVILCTGYAEKYALQGHHVAIDGYLAKPVRQVDLIALLDRLQLRVEWKPQDVVLWVRAAAPVEERISQNKTQRKVRPLIAVPIDSIAKLQSYGNELAVYKMDKVKGQSVIGYMRGSIIKVYRKYKYLDLFLRPNASVLVNPMYITKLEGDMLTLEDTEVILVTRSGREEIKVWMKKKSDGIYEEK